MRRNKTSFGEKDEETSAERKYLRLTGLSLVTQSNCPKIN